MTESDTLPLVTVRACELSLAVDGPIHEHDEPWVYRLTDADESPEWWIAISGPDHAGHEIGPPDGMSIKSKPYHVTAWKNGLLVYDAPPQGGRIVGDHENEMIGVLEGKLRDLGVDMADEGDPDAESFRVDDEDVEKACGKADYDRGRGDRSE